MPTPSPLPGPLTRADALAILRTRFSKGDLRMVVAQPEGAAMIESMIAIHVDASARLDRSITARHLIQRDSDVSPIAAGASAAKASVMLARAPGAIGRGRVIGAGVGVQTSDGHVFTLDAAVTFAAGEAGPKAAAVTAAVPGASSNAPAFAIDRFVPSAGHAGGDRASLFQVISSTQFVLIRGAGDFFAGECAGLYVQFTGGTNSGREALILSVSGDGSSCTLQGDGSLVFESGTAVWQVVDFDALGFLVTQSADATPGSDDELDAIGREMGRHRQTGEADDSLREALVTAEEVVTPEAMVSIANRILGSYGPVELYEAFAGGADADPVLNSRPWPGPIAGRTAAGINPRNAKEGLAYLVPSKSFFLLKCNVPGVMWVGGYCVPYGTTPKKRDGRPMGAIAGRTPAGLFARGRQTMLSAIAAQIRAAKGGGTGWLFFPPT